MHAIHGLDNGIDLADNESTIGGFQNKARNLFYFQTHFRLYFYLLCFLFKGFEEARF